MKKLTFILCLLAFSFGTYAAEVSEEVMKVFAKSYPEVKTATWEDTKDGYRVFFTRNDISYRIFYDAEGNISLALKYYAEENLPPIINNKVKKAYPEYKIYSVIEKSTDTSVEYHIIIEGQKKLITLKSDPLGFFEVESKYNKAG